MKKEVENLKRIKLVLKTAGKYVIRSLLLQRYKSEEQLTKTINRPGVKRKLEKARLKSIISDKHWSILYPELLGGVGEEVGQIQYKNVDFALYVILLRKLGDLPKPVRGWNEWPRNTDKNNVSNVVRLKLVHEEVEKQTKLNEQNFESVWKSLEMALLGLNYSAHGLGNLKTCCVESERDLAYYWYHVWNSPELHRSELIAFLVVTLILMCIFDWWDSVIEILEKHCDLFLWYYYKFYRIIFG
jgi:hypothetical protein